MAVTWAQLAPATTPFNRRRFDLVWDPVRAEIVMGAGQFLLSTTDHTYTWDGSDWTDTGQRWTDWGISASGRAMGWDDANSEVVAFGGSDGSGNENDHTWTWNGTAWTQESPAAEPSARVGAGIAYCPAINAPVLFGGSNGGIQDDTWKWTGANWVDLSPSTTPPERSQMAIATYDTGVIMFGGLTTGSVLLDDTWFFDGTDWTDMSPTTTPPARYQTAATLYEDTGNAWMYGGSGPTVSTYLNDTWWWDGNDWNLETPITNPGARYGFGLAWDGNTNSLILFGGQLGTDIDQSDDTWTLVEATGPAIATISVELGMP